MIVEEVSVAGDEVVEGIAAVLMMMIEGMANMMPMLGEMVMEDMTERRFVVEGSGLFGTVAGAGDESACKPMANVAGILASICAPGVAKPGLAGGGGGCGYSGTSADILLENASSLLREHFHSRVLHHIHRHTVSGDVR